MVSVDASIPSSLNPEPNMNNPLTMPSPGKKNKKCLISEFVAALQKEQIITSSLKKCNAWSGYALDGTLTQQSSVAMGPTPSST